MLRTCVPRSDNPVTSCIRSRSCPTSQTESVGLLVSLPTMTASKSFWFNGGTGISARDRTYDVLSREIEKELTGFGELFRMLSFEQVGAAAMLSRATAGVCLGKVVISVPGFTCRGTSGLGKAN